MAIMAVAGIILLQLIPWKMLYPIRDVRPAFTGIASIHGFYPLSWKQGEELTTSQDLDLERTWRLSQSLV